MKEINLMREMLQQHLQWNAARLAFVSIFLIALIRVKTVNLAEIATGFSGKAKVESHYKRLQNGCSCLGLMCFYIKLIYDISIGLP